MLIVDPHPVRVQVSTVMSSQIDKHNYIQHLQTHRKTRLIKTERQTFLKDMSQKQIFLGCNPIKKLDPTGTSPCDFLIIFITFVIFLWVLYNSVVITFLALSHHPLRFAEDSEKLMLQTTFKTTSSSNTNVTQQYLPYIAVALLSFLSFNV